MQVDSLGEINEALRAEYSLRRRMLIERAKVTLQVSRQRCSCLLSKCLLLSDLKGSESPAGLLSGAPALLQEVQYCCSVSRAQLPDVL